MTPNDTVVPMVVESSHKGDRAFDIYSRLLRDRIIILGTPIDNAVASTIIAQLLFLDGEDAEKDVHLYINSPGGQVSAGLAIYDTMQITRAPVSTYCVGMCASMAAILLAAGTKGKRHILPNSDVMIHQPMGGAQGQASDIEIQAKQILKARERLNRILAAHTGKDVDQIAKDTDRDNFMTAEEAVAYGLVDTILKRK